MKIAGMQKNSFVDYRGKVATVIFTPLCNFDCFYCHNSQLLVNNDRYDGEVEEEYFFSYLDKRIGLIDGIVISGGEPTLQKDLDVFIKKIKDKGFYVKLDTNGYRPDVLNQLIENNLLDYVAMDLKAPFSKYEEITNCKIDIKKIEKSINILKTSNIIHEFRTTVIPTFSLEDIEEMVKTIKGTEYYVLQQFHKPEGRDRLIDLRNSKPPHKKAFFTKAIEICDKYIKNIETRALKE